MSDKGHYNKRKSGGGKRRQSGAPPRGEVLDSADQRLVELIVKLGDNTNANTLENHLTDLVSNLQDPSRHKVILNTIFRCVVALPFKPGIYAALLSLMCRENGDLVNLVVERLKFEFTNAFANCDYYALKFLCRFSMELANANLITTASVYTLYEKILQNSTHLDTIPQHIQDFYASIIISSLILGYRREMPKDLLTLLEKHFSSRKSLFWISPFDQIDTPSSSEVRIDTLNHTPGKDSLEVLFVHFKEFLENAASASSNGNDHSVQNSSDATSSATNGNSSTDLLRVAIQPFQYPSISARLFGPSEAPKSVLFSDDIDWFDSEKAESLISFQAWVEKENSEIRANLGLEPYVWPQSVIPCHFTLPKVMCHIFPSVRTSGEGKLALSSIERWYLEDYALDTMHFFRSTHVDIPRHMSFCRHLTDYFDFSAFACELIFKDFLRVPSGPYPPVHHGVIILDFVLKYPAFGGVMVEATNRLFGSLPNLSVSARSAFMDWFSYHLSNTEFKWDWKEWCLMVQQVETRPKHENDGSGLSPTSEPHSHFIREVLSALVRLSYYERIAPTITAAVPDYAKQWLPAKPEPSAASGFYVSDLGLAIQEQIRDRTQPAEALLQPVLNCGTAVPLTSEQVVACVMRAILVEGTTSITLLQSTLAKYRGVLEKVSYGTQVNLETPQNGAHHMLQACLDYYPHSPQHFTIAALALLHHKLISAENLVSLLLKPELVARWGNSFFWWDLLSHAVRSVTQAQAVLELEIINKWRLACKSDLNADPKLLAQRTLERSEINVAGQDMTKLALLTKPLIASLFSSLLDLLAHPPSPSILWLAQGSLEVIAMKNRRLLANVVSDLEILVSALPAPTAERIKRLKSFCEQC